MLPVTSVVLVACKQNTFAQCLSCPRFNCIFVGTNSDHPEEMGISSYVIAHVLMFFSFTFKGVLYPCAAIQWFNKIGDSPDEDTRMWMVHPAFLPNHSPHTTVIHSDTVYCAAHLVPIHSSKEIPCNIKPYHLYDAFRAFYVNKYADYHTFEIAG
ncbi:hypothetical protein PAXRUDRAFT_173213 [Paxillus rubicundulus Ve08.2h10]|uniref:Uncharacterized protein n=1 Tax=Paxillus rubicundulus Ve08.2h10 TaxID=930991 RepID=A0A0D0DD64_9AGAM|nr:hypothetical protein PAXRUDRAFT_173213 [Paxillus rubicundulus Ve08.2h10]